MIVLGLKLEALLEPPVRFIFIATFLPLLNKAETLPDCSDEQAENVINFLFDPAVYIIIGINVGRGICRMVFH